MKLKKSNRNGIIRLLTYSGFSFRGIEFQNEILLINILNFLNLGAAMWESNSFCSIFSI